MQRLRAALAQCAQRRAANAILLLLETGARRSEVLTAEWTHFDLDRGTWTKPSSHTKQKRTSHVPLSARAWALVSTMREAAVAEARDLLRNTAGADRADEAVQPLSPYLFPGYRDGKPLKELKRTWENVVIAAKLPPTRIHDLRHTFASHLVSDGSPLLMVGRLLGHTQGSTTQRYAHLATDPLRDAANRFAMLFDDPRITEPTPSNVLPMRKVG